MTARLSCDGLSVDLAAEGRVTVGRAVGNRILLASPLVSSEHGLFRFSEGVATFRDLGSTNGTYLVRGGEPRPVGTEDIILAGTGELRFGAADGESVVFEIGAPARDAQACYREGVERVRAGDLEGAADRFRAALELAPGAADCYKQLARLALRAGELDEALGHARAYIVLRPRDEVGYVITGHIEERRGEPSAAMRAYRMALSIDPASGEARRRLEALSRNASVRHDGRRERGSELLGDAAQTVRTEHFTIRFDLRTHGGQIAEVAKAAEVARAGLLAAYPVELPPTLEVELFPDAGSLARAHPSGAEAGGKAARGLTTEAGFALVLEREPTLPAPVLRQAIRHELAHVAIRSTAGRAVPWWLDEGLALILSVAPSLEMEDILEDLARAGRLLPLEVLERGMLDHSTAEVDALASHHAHGLCLYLADRAGIDALLGALREAGTTSGLLAALGIDEEALEDQWARWLADRGLSRSAVRTRPGGEAP